MNQKKLGESLNGVVEDCVNKVGVDLNTASAPLLSCISGISSAIAKNIVAYREENGRFASRKELLKVAKLGPKAFEQSAGFMRIQGGENPLDGTGVHPESYEAAEKLLKKQGYTPEDITGGNLTGLSLTIKDYKKLAEELGIGEITLRDIVKELEKPARDPREEMPNTDPADRRAGDERLKRGNGLKRDGAQCHRLSAYLWISACIRTDWYIFPDHGPLYQAPVGSGQRRRHRL